MRAPRLGDPLEPGRVGKGVQAVGALDGAADPEVTAGCLSLVQNLADTWRTAALQAAQAAG